MVVCWHCLMAIESREGNQFTRRLECDDDRLDDEGQMVCEWCEEVCEYSELYEIQ